MLLEKACTCHDEVRPHVWPLCSATQSSLWPGTHWKCCVVYQTPDGERTPLITASQIHAYSLGSGSGIGVSARGHELLFKTEAEPPWPVGLAFLWISDKCFEFKRSDEQWHLTLRSQGSALSCFSHSRLAAQACSISHNWHPNSLQCRGDVAKSWHQLSAQIERNSTGTSEMCWWVSTFYPSHGCNSYAREFFSKALFS